MGHSALDMDRPARPGGRRRSPGIGATLFAMRRRTAALVILVMVSLAACSVAPSATPTSAGGQVGDYSVLPAIVSTELAVGQNRVVFSFLDPKTNLPAAAPDRTVSLKAYPDAKGPSAAITGEGHFVWATQGVNGFYYTYLTFDEAGAWTAEFTTQTPSSAAETIPFKFDVAATRTAIGIGDQVPSVKTPTLADFGGDVKQISTDQSPDPALYQVSEDQAVAQHDPFVLVFATPAFCQTQTCGPMLDQVKAIAAQFPTVTFINVEPYKLHMTDTGLQPILDASGNLQPVPAVDAFKIVTEPWTYVVDRTGKVTASFEGVIGTDELTAAVKAIQ